MDLQTLLIIDIGIIVAIPMAVFFFNSLIGIVATTILTSILLYLDTLTFRKLRNENTDIIT